jgi:hypothetical protein
VYTHVHGADAQPAIGAPSTFVMQSCGRGVATAPSTFLPRLRMADSRIRRAVGVPPSALRKGKSIPLIT